MKRVTRTRKLRRMKKIRKLKTLKALKQITDFTINSILIVIVIIGIVLLFQVVTNKEEVPNFLNYKFFLITSGSMEPKIKINDFIVIKEKEADKLKIGDIITFKENNVFITHRIIDIYKENGVYFFSTKGDNNNVKDNNKVCQNNIEGEYKLKVPLLGNIISYIKTPIGLFLTCFFPIIYYLIKKELDMRSQIKKELKK